MAVSDFFSQYAPYAQSVSRSTGIDPRIVLAQAALETGYGRSAPNYNLFGIKGKGSTQQTKEFVDGKMVSMPQEFRAYGSPEESFQDYAKLMSGKRYEGVRSGDTLEEQIAALQKSGYATDPEYGQKIMQIAKGINLEGLPMNGPTQQQQPQGLLGSLLGGQGIGGALGLSEDFRDRLAMGIMAGSDPRQFAPLIQQRAASMQERKAEKKLQGQVNKTVEWLKSKNRKDLVGAVMTGVIDPASAIQAALAKPKEKTYQYQSLVKDLMTANPNLSYKDALDMALSQTKSATTVNVGPTGIDYGKPPANMAWRRDSAGNVMLDANGAPMAVPISGTELAEKLSAAEEAEKKAISAKEVAQTTVSRSVKDALAIMDNKGFSDIFPEAGTIGKFLADYTWNQDARNLRRTLQSLQANTAFTRLQEMRDASKTGGALGNVSNVELELLMSSYGSLSQDLSPDMLRTNLKNIEKVMGKIEEDPVARAFYEDGVDLRGSEIDAQVKAGNGSNTVIEYDAQGNRVK